MGEGSGRQPHSTMRRSLYTPSLMDEDIELPGNGNDYTDVNHLSLEPVGSEWQDPKICGLWIKCTKLEAELAATRWVFAISFAAHISNNLF